MNSRIALAGLVVAATLSSAPADAVAPKDGARRETVRIDLRHFAQDSHRRLLWVATKRSKADTVAGYSGTLFESAIRPAVVRRPVQGRCAEVHAVWSRPGGARRAALSQWFTVCR